MTASPASLSAAERGFLAAIARLGGEKPALDRVLDGEGMRVAWRELGERGRDQRVTAMAAWMTELVGPLAPRIAELDPSWALEALADEPPELARALAEELPLVAEGLGPGPSWPLPAEARVELQRLVFGALAALTVEPPGPLGAQLAAMSGDELLAELARWGARTIGTSLAGSPLELRARAMANAGAPWSSELATAAARPTDPRSRDQARALVARGSTRPALTPLHRLRAVGALAIAVPLAAEGESSVWRVAGRLPVDLGRALLATRWS